MCRPARCCRRSGRRAASDRLLLSGAFAREFLPKDFFRDRVVIVGLSMQSAPAADQGGAGLLCDLVHAAQPASGVGRGDPGDDLRKPHQAAAYRYRLALAAGGLHACRGAACRRRDLAPDRLADGRALGSRHRRASSRRASCCCISAGSTCRRSRRRSPSSRWRPHRARATTRPSGGCGAASCAPSRSICRRSWSSGSPRDPAQLHLGGERKTLSILFSDVRGFTTISETLKDEPERLTALMNRLLNPLSGVVLAEGGTIDKYIGDAIMAFWNAPLDDADHALHAVAAALGMLDALDGLNAELRGRSRAAGVAADEAQDRHRHQHRRLRRRQYGLRVPLRLFRARRRGQPRGAARKRDQELRRMDPARRTDRATGCGKALRGRARPHPRQGQVRGNARSRPWCRRPTARRWPSIRRCSTISMAEGSRRRTSVSGRWKKSFPRLRATTAS